MTYNVFHRTWWKRNKEWTDGKEPSAGRKHYIIKNLEKISQARDVAKICNATHLPGFLSDRAEIEEE